MTIVVGDADPFDLDEAKAVIAGYCFATRPLTWKKPKGSEFGSPPTESRVPRWAYGTYDGIPPGQGDEVSPIDLYVADGLNARAGSWEFASMQVVVGGAFAALSAVPNDVTFWGLPREAIDDPPEGSHAWHLHRAWWLMEGTVGLKRARVHKVLHHKRPLLVPLLDGKTEPALLRTAIAAGHRNTWVAIFDDLSRHGAEFDELEGWFAAIPGVPVPLRRLRLHDILLWCHVTDARMAAAEGGAGFI